ncbi:MAG: exodeoxyribonuclease VII large subunit [Candidatus Moranbacteria bacterium]|jgi:exodeoxyribonuclease VII large subunit|nr:exodeoxyribonuclease VII large subunit [Candidatus Moranbacteria bacterium]MBP9801069.1 exodeoxyribonuclease VII large subunit [Candidatus Moranbacteria bacterium]
MIREYLLKDLSMDVRGILWQWRRKQAEQEGVEVFRVLPNAVLEALLLAIPQTKEELLAIKGIKEAKYRKYGKAILGILAGLSKPEITSDKGGLQDFFSSITDESLSSTVTEQAAEEKPLSISQFLDGLNIELSGMAARVQGEISSVDERERVVYFTLKDSTDGSTLNCLMFRSAYQMAGVRLVIGGEVIAEGSPDIYKPSGRLSFKVGFLVLAGEGAIKKAYDALLEKFSQEGLLAPERKRVLPPFPSRVALITSEQGAALGDFTMNLGRLGIRVDFYPASVEGNRSVPDILEALRFFSQQASKYDLLVMIRGGGSLESLQAFNNEMLVRAIAECPIPTLLGIGHEKDVTLAALVADVMVSTPTATARTLREPFERARQTVLYAEKWLPERFERVLSQQKTLLEGGERVLTSVFPRLRERFVRAEQELVRMSEQIVYALRLANKQLEEAEVFCLSGYQRLRETFSQKLLSLEEKLREYDPERALSLGYSLIRSQGKIVRNVEEVKIGSLILAQIQNGMVEAEVKHILSNKHTKV